MISKYLAPRRDNLLKFLSLYLKFEIYFVVTVKSRPDFISVFYFLMIQIRLELRSVKYFALFIISHEQLL